jgi:hypothetical protein
MTHGNSKECATCDYQNPVTARFCARCGAALGLPAERPQSARRWVYLGGCLVALVLVGVGLFAAVVWLRPLFERVAVASPTWEPALVTWEPVEATRELHPTLRATFIGQDRQSYAGQGCSTGTVLDNVHIRLNGLKSGVQPISYRVDDPSGGGVWSAPCDPVSNWLLYVIPTSSNGAELYFKPFRDAQDGIPYIVSVQYDDGTTESITIMGSKVQTLLGTFLGQDGQSYAGQRCSTGTVPDNVHIQLNGLKSSTQVISYRVDDFAGGGVWATPCDPVSNWLLYVKSSSSGQADLYFKPFRDAPDGTIYTIWVQYSDGTGQTIEVIGMHVIP